MSGLVHLAFDHDARAFELNRHRCLQNLRSGEIFGVGVVSSERVGELHRNHAKAVDGEIRRVDDSGQVTVRLKAPPDRGEALVVTRKAGRPLAVGERPGAIGSPPGVPKLGRLMIAAVLPPVMLTPEPVECLPFRCRRRPVRGRRDSSMRVRVGAAPAAALRRLILRPSRRRCLGLQPRPMPAPSPEPPSPLSALPEGDMAIAPGVLPLGTPFC